MITRRNFIATATAGTAIAAGLPAHAFEVEEKFRPQQVRIKADLLPGQILILPRAHFLYFVTAPGQAIRYGVGVGRAGLEFTGDAVIQVKKEWPTWRPTQEMIERDPSSYGRFRNNDYVQPGGPTNPLGARALYLFQNGKDTLYRLHGTPEYWTIGKAVSSGCVRLMNQDIIDLFDRVATPSPIVVRHGPRGIA